MPKRVHLIDDVNSHELPGKLSECHGKSFADPGKLKDLSIWLKNRGGKFALLARQITYFFLIRVVTDETDSHEFPRNIGENPMMFEAHHN